MVLSLFGANLQKRSIGPCRIQLILGSKAFCAPEEEIHIHRNFVTGIGILSTNRAKRTGLEMKKTLYVVLIMACMANTLAGCCKVENPSGMTPVETVQKYFYYWNAKVTEE